MADNLRELQLTELEMLKKFKYICEKNDLTYYLSSGTLLGAIRHQGFIPWDDDVDVCMPYEDYKRFCAIAQDELGDDYFVQTCMTDPNYYSPYAKIRANNTTLLEQYFRRYDIHHGVWIDILPIIEINPGLEYKVKKFILKALSILQIENHMVGQPDDFRNAIGTVGMGLVKLVSKIPMGKRQQLHQKWLDKLFSATGKRSCVEVYASFYKTSIPFSVYGEPSKVVFEGSEFYGPHDCDHYLTTLYGDYMTLPPVEDRVNHLGEEGILDLHHSYEMYMEHNT